MKSSSTARSALFFAKAVLCLAAISQIQAADKPQPGDREIRIPTIDISQETERHVVIAEGTEETYQGHPTTLLMPDGKAMFCVWSVNHGGPCGPMKRSDDGGKNWSDLLPVPDNWREVENCPAIYRLADPSGVTRLFVFAGQGPGGSMHQSHSEDGGKTWTPMAPNGLVCVMPFCTIELIDGGKRLLAMSNIRRPGETEETYSNVVAQSISSDGGMTWSQWRVVLDLPGCKPCEPELIRSPDGNQLLCLMRENNRSFNAWKMVSDDEGQTWTEARQLPASLSGDRHKASYAPDGRLVVCFRDTAAKSPTKNHFVAWVGTCDDIVAVREGHYRVKLLHNHAGSDCGYPGLERLPDGTFVATTYVKYDAGPRKHSVVSARFTLDELDRKVLAGKFVPDATGKVRRSGLPNLARKAAVTASSGVRYFSAPAENAIDGVIKQNSRWVSEKAKVHHLTLAWPENQTIGRVRVWTGLTGRPELPVNDFTIQTWDGANWQIAASVRDNEKAGPEEHNDLCFDPVTTDRLRMEITRTPTDQARVFEIEVYGPDGEPASIGQEPQLFVDDDRIAKRSGVTRTIHACRKLPNPVLETEFPWEGNEEDSRVYLYGTVLRDGESGEFRMWYNRGRYELFATSRDGVRWERPRLGLVEFERNRENNIVAELFHSPSFIFDEREKDSAKRYKMLGSMGKKGYGVAWSADGLEWHPYPGNPVLRHSDTCTLAQDPKTGEYLAFHKIHAGHRGHRRRLVWLATSTDMQTWSKPQLVMAPDEIDDAQTRAEGGLWSEFYNMSVFPYGGQFLGLVTHFRYSGKPPEEGPDQSPADGPIDVQLAHSRDGHEWRRLAERKPVIPNGPHDYDAGCILGLANQPVIVDDEMWFYYTAITTTHGGYLPEKKITIARAAWRLDGFVSLDAGVVPGVVETVALRPSFDRLTVNADASKGELRVEVLDASGKPLPGYEAEACVPIRTDNVRHQVRWKGNDRLPGDRPIRLRFLLKNAQLFSYKAT